MYLTGFIFMNTTKSIISSYRNPTTQKSKKKTKKTPKDKLELKVIKSV